MTPPEITDGSEEALALVTKASVLYEQAGVILLRDAAIVREQGEDTGE
ncbi:MAG: hypothetical protein ACRDZO_01535 [Egibacteraceae bacterium]